ncbi:DNA-binding transcriptional regulator, LysR family [Paracoccus alcaliphilus]|uniref:DNA-binding transcriptional regulator, LysR family n=2 Tax=Paracoccus alcaliphilus TaxID=34002 RepID=A0A1H8F457_9RHOB|nr:DNA-binding transcriptional regulator, LysR family [Paracoccus alcaliphilus]
MYSWIYRNHVPRNFGLGQRGCSMLIRHLDFFVTLAEEEHFGRAAELCGVSQPALSLAIRKLEEDLGATLVLRGKRFMGLTAEGQKALAWGRQILADYGHLRDDLVGRRKGGLTGRLRLGVIAPAMPLVPLISARFEARNPMARIAIRLMSSPDIATAIRQFDLDGGLTWLEGRAPANSFAQPLWSERALFACRKDHPFAPDPSVPWRDAVTQPLCVAEGAIAAYLETRHIRPAITCTSLDGVLAHLRAGFWCGIVPTGFRALLAPGDEVVLRDLDDGGPRMQLGATLMKRDPQSPMVQALQDCIASLTQDGSLTPP